MKHFSGTLCTDSHGLQHRHLPANLGAAGSRSPLFVVDATREADEDQSVGDGRCVNSELTEVAVRRALFADILRRVNDLRPLAVASDREGEGESDMTKEGMLPEETKSARTG